MSGTHRIHGAAIYGAPWIPSIYPSHVSIYTSTMDPMGMIPFRNLELAVALKIVEKLCLHHESSSVWFWMENLSLSATSCRLRVTIRLENRDLKNAKVDHSPYAPCMVYLPTFGWILRQMLVNIPYMEYMGSRSSQRNMRNLGIPGLSLDIDDP